MAGMIATPSAYQMAIFDYVQSHVLNFEGPVSNLTINAVAGAGKTSTITHIAHLVDRKLRADSMFLAFNSEIARELQTRMPEGLRASTLHALGRKICVDSFGPKNATKYVEKFKYWNVAADLLSDDEGTEFEQIAERKRALVEACSKARLTMIDLDNDDQWFGMLSAFEIVEFPTMRGLIKVMLSRGLQMGRDGLQIDFDDMIWIPAFMSDDPKMLRSLIMPDFKLIILDEAQDLNVAQRKFVLACRAKNARVIAVGDPRQSIYGFAGADTSSFETLTAVLEAHELPLSVTYRCAVSHVDIAREIVPHIEAAPNAKAGHVEYLRYENIAERVDPKAGDMILSRVTAPLIGLLFELIAARIPAKMKGSELAPIVNLAKSIAGKRCNWDQFGSKIDVYFEAERNRLLSRRNGEMMVAALQDKCDCLSMLWEQSILARVKDIRQFEDWLKSLFSDDTKGVTLTTIHRAKGLEAENVFILNPDGMPHPMARTPEAQAQEMNVKYVALTRAKTNLYLVSPKR